MRKTNGYEIADRIKVFYNGDEDILDALETFKEYVMDETLATVYEVKDSEEVVDINGHDVMLTIEKN